MKLKNYESPVIKHLSYIYSVKNKKAFDRAMEMSGNLLLDLQNDAGEIKLTKYHNHPEGMMYLKH